MTLRAPDNAGMRAQLCPLLGCIGTRGLSCSMQFPPSPMARNRAFFKQKNLSFVLGALAKFPVPAVGIAVATMKPGVALG